MPETTNAPAKPEQPVSRREQRRQDRMNWLMSNIEVLNSVKDTRPSSNVAIVLNTNSAFKNLMYNYQYVDDALFHIAVVLRIIASQSVIDETDKDVEDAFVSIEEDLKASIAKLKADAEAEGLDLTQFRDYQQVRELTIRYHSPKSHRFLKIIQMVDEFNSIVDAAWLANKFTDDSHAKLLRGWSLNIGNLSRRLINIRRNAVDRAHRLGRTQEVRAQGVPIDADQEAASVIDEEVADEVMVDKKDIEDSQREVSMDEPVVEDLPADITMPDLTNEEAPEDPIERDDEENR